MLIKKDAKRWIAESTYQEKDILKEARWRWSPEDKAWWTDDPAKAAKLAKFADGVTKRGLEKIAGERTKKLAASSAKDSKISVPAPEGLAYMPFQRAGIAFGMSRENVLIGDEMGLGKTIQAIGLINATKAKRVLVVCPASLRLNWRNELQKWLTVDREIGIAQGKAYPTGADIVIINYDIIHSHADALRAEEWDIMIADEIHYCKNEKARRTQYTLGYTKAEKKKGQWIDTVKVAPIPAKRRVFLTGTPIANRPIELWPIVKALGVFDNFWGYAKRYCNASQNQWGWDLTGSSNLLELQETLRTEVMLRRLKKDVLTDLPAKMRQVIEIPANGATAHVTAERDAWSQWEEGIVDLRVAVELAKASDDPAEYDNAVAALRDGLKAAFGEMSKLRHETAVAKIPHIVDHLTEALESTDKVVVMAHHRSVIQGLREALDVADIRYVSLTGADSLTARQEAVEAFQGDPKVQVFIGSIQAAGVGITLTAASHVIFAELDWVPANLSQAEDRCHRIGQSDSVLIQHLVLEGSLDAVMAKKLVGKQQVIDEAMDKDIPEFKLPTIPTVEATETPRKQIEEVAAKLTPAEIEAVHRGLQELAMMCDGAREIDGMGFNKFDTAIGKSLAGAITLSPKQAALGQKLVRKYRRQLPEGMLSESGII